MNVISAALVVGLPFARGVVAVRMLLESVLNARIAGADNASSPALEEVEHLVARDGEQPAAEGAAHRVVIEPAHRGRHGSQHVLHQVGGVRVLQAALAGETVNDGRVEARELSPRVSIAAVAQADQKVTRRVMDRDAAVEYFKGLGEFYKAEIIASIPAGEAI